MTARHAIKDAVVSATLGAPDLTVGGGSTLSLVLTKSASTAGVVSGTERLARSHPKGAVVWLMVCLNAALAAAVAHTYSVSRAMR